MRLAPAPILLMAFGCTLCAMAGCSNGAGPPKTGNLAKMTSAAPNVASSVCDRHILKPEDVAGILSSPITGTQPLPGDAQSCEFTTATFPAIIVSVRPGLGRTTLDAWASGKMPLDSSPLAGVGDAAVWQETLHEVIAQKNAVLCDIQVRGGGSDLALNTKGLPTAVGALCNKIFAGY
jgi:hypothetical protein